MYKKIIISLDVDSLGEASKFIFEGPAVYKVGWRLFSAAGFQVFDFLEGAGKKVFLDLKFFDIPNTVEKAVRNLLRFKPYALTIHALAGKEVIKRVAKARDELSPDTLLLAVTVLTSLSAEDLRELGMEREPGFYVRKLAELAKESGADGIVCSGQELDLVRDLQLLRVVPGVRLSSEKHDQKRVITPHEAFEKGADFIVVGRPILEADDPKRAFQEIAADAGFVEW